MRLIKLTDPYMKGEDVKHIQERLIAHGHSIDPDGAYGELTRDAVLSFQTAHNLDPDGVVGSLTLAALDASPETVEPSALALGLVDWCYKCLGDIYVLGGDGEAMTSESACRRFAEGNDTSAKQAARSVALYRKKVSYGQTDMHAYDCSGLISSYLESLGYVKKKRNCNHLWAASTEITRDKLIAGDLVFRRRTNGKKSYHVGVCVGRGLVIESMGRDSGVVIRGINESKAGYWTHCGRLNILYGGKI